MTLKTKSYNGHVACSLAGPRGAKSWKEDTVPKGIFARRVREVIIPIGPSIAYVPLTQGQFALIDRADAAKVGQRNWFAQWDHRGRRYYAARQIAIDGKRQSPLFLHRDLCAEAGLGEPVDHRNGYSLDDRRSNLRPATHSQNAFNQGARSHSRSGLKGAHYCSRNKRWSSSIAAPDGRVWLGYFDSAEAAHLAYGKASALMHGAYARTA